MIEKIAVLLRVQYFEQCRGRVSLVGSADLVDFVQHDNRVGRLGILERLDELAGHRADVGAPVTLDLGLVAHAAERKAEELAAQRAGDGTAQRGLAHTGRPDEQDNRAGNFAFQDADPDEFQDALLDVLETVVVLVQNLLGALQVELVFSIFPPRQLRQPVEIVAGGGVLG